MSEGEFMFSLWGGGTRPVDPDEEAARLARERLDPPQREWGVRHPDGRVTVRATGHPFSTRGAADEQRAFYDHDCDHCDIQGGPHGLVYRDRQPWREAPGSSPASLIGD